MSAYPTLEMRSLTWAGRTRVAYGTIGYRLIDPQEASLAVRVARAQRAHFVETFLILLAFLIPGMVAGLWAIKPMRLIPVSIGLVVSFAVSSPFIVWWTRRQNLAGERLNEEVMTNPHEAWPKPRLLPRRARILYAVVFGAGLALSLTEGVGETLEFLGLWAVLFLLTFLPWWVIWRRP
ncbi:MAG: hypothetical protein WD770_02175 [Actinomycetota bacterium]